MPNFQWESSNLKHIIEDYPQRGNTIEEIESVFDDGNLRVLLNQLNFNEEARFKAVGLSNLSRVLIVFLSSGMTKFSQ